MVETDTRPFTGPLRRFSNALGKFAELSPTMPVMQVLAFMVVAQNEGKSLGELGKIANIKQSTMSRYLLDLSDKTRIGAAGYGLVKRESDPQELRRNMYSLTPKGRLLVREIEEIN